MKRLWMVLSLSLLLGACADNTKKEGLPEHLSVVTTTTMITDMVEQIGGDAIEVQGLMGSGVDPHLYKASEGDVTKLYNADLIIYNGLHLEGKLVEVFEKMNEQGKKTLAISDALDQSTLIGSDYFASSYDPHIWFEIDYWTQMTSYVTEELKKIAPKHAETFESNSQNYLKQINALKTELTASIGQLPENRRILVTAHDAFNYFGRSFGFQVVGLQGLSTATEAGVQDVQRMTQFIIDNKINAIFVESSVPRRTVEALQAAVKAQGHEVAIGGELFSDALGSAGTPEGTYVGMYKHNVETIVKALK
ncbi:metal ABC transporter solute-binding protein, Zn/Mn family [Nonlabens xiamenensis]|uniref:metal ABC transporter solute-binding protein, Zn/Mn family n=1 Tax=Nonlabens xiamenensis TaxID=2341043 RepID=UPI000F609D10|nr:zinc ABC transporter substrate-binding protein [Nonlabens xiamenensis]